MTPNQRTLEIIRLLAVVETQKLQITDLEKKLKQETSAKEMYSRIADTANKEIEQVHSMIDIMPNSSPRKSTGCEHEWQQVTFSLLARVAHQLVTK